MNNLLRFAAVAMLLAAPIHAQTTQAGKILKWDTEAYGKHGNVTRNAAVYYIQIADTIYQVTRGTTKPEPSLGSGQQVQCRIEKHQCSFLSDRAKS
jgi:hypothetical protein